VTGAVEKLQPYGSRTEVVESLQCRLYDSVVTHVTQDIDQCRERNRIVQVLAEIPKQEFPRLLATDLTQAADSADTHTWVDIVEGVDQGIDAALVAETPQRFGRLRADVGFAVEQFLDEGLGRFW